MNPITKALPPIHPGEILVLMFLLNGDDELVGPERIRQLRGIEGIEDVLMCRAPVTPEIADHLGDIFVQSPGFWLNLQTGYDEDVK